MGISLSVVTRVCQWTEIINFVKGLGLAIYRDCMTTGRHWYLQEDAYKLHLPESKLRTFGDVEIET